MQTKFDRQESLYSFPYHYLPHFEEEGLPRISRKLAWGIEYLTYMTAVRNTIEQLPGSTLLDVGCGDGFLLNEMHRPETRKSGVDLSERAIAYARAFATDAEFSVQDIFTLEETFDIVVLTEVLEHIQDTLIREFVAKVKSLVAPGGYLLVTVPTTVVPLIPKHYRHYDEELLDTHFGSTEGWDLQAERRLYRHSRNLARRLRLLDNRYWTVNHPALWKRFWRRHLEKDFYADRTDGKHLMRLYRKH